MATIEERLTLIEHGYAELKNDNTELKKTVELQTITIGALVNKAMLERLNEKNDKIFEALIAHDSFTNAQLAEVREQLIEQDGKVIGMQTEMRQRFEQQGGQIVGMQTEMRQRFEQQDKRFEQQDKRFEQQDKRFEQQDKRFEQQDKQIVELRSDVSELRGDVSIQGQKIDQILLLLNTLINKPE